MYLWCYLAVNSILDFLLPITGACTQKIQCYSTGAKPSDDDLGMLIYTGPKNKEVHMVKYFSLSTSAIGILLQPYLLTQMSANGPLVKMSIVAFTGFFVIGTPFLLHFLCKRYVLRMYYNELTNTFTAVRLNFLARQKYFSFTPDDVNETTVDPLSNFQAKGQGFLLDTDEIREKHPDAYIALKRYNEPIDLNKYIVEQKSDKKTVPKDDIESRANASDTKGNS